MDRTRAIHVCREIQVDCEADVKKWEHKPLTGPNVAIMHGETMAMISTLATILEGLLMALESGNNG